jgi:hypothetical protein
MINQYYPFDDFENIIWLNNSIHEGWEIAMVNLKYGDEASLMWHYSHATILVNVPPVEERKKVAMNRGKIKFPDWHARKRGVLRKSASMLQ